MNCIIRGLQAEEYHADLGTISKHGLDLINQAPALYHHEKTVAHTKTQTPAMRWGTLVHTVVLEPHLFPHQTVIAPDVDKRTKEGKAALASLALDGRTVITQDEHADLIAIRDSVHRHPAASMLLSGDIEVENSVFWTDDETGIACRCRPDVIRCDGVVVDLKTTQEAGFSPFSRTAANFRYHVQAAMYLDGLRANGVSAEAFVFIAVEKEPPYLVQCFAADDEMIDAGRAAYRKDLETYAQCLTSGQWPGYSDLITPLSLPVWATK